MPNIQRDQYKDRSDVSQSKPQWALPTIEQKSAQFVNSTFTAGTDFTVPAGAAAASVTIQLKFAPILGNNGRTGYFGNTTLVLGGAIATTLATEVAFVSDADGKGGDVTTLTNGQYMVDYETGIIYGKRADNATTGTAVYSYWLAGSVAGTGTSSNQIQGAAASGTTAVGNPVLSAGEYLVTAPTLTNAQVYALMLDALANLMVTQATKMAGEDLTNDTLGTSIKKVAAGTYSPSRFQNLGANATLNVKATAGVVSSIKCRNTTAAPRYFQLHNTATTPSGGAVPFWHCLVPAGSEVIVGEDHFSEMGIAFSTGIAFAVSTTSATYTAATATDHETYVLYV